MSDNDDAVNQKPIKRTRSFTEPTEREKKFLDSIEPLRLKRLVPYLTFVFVLLNFMDVLTTLSALRNHVDYIELNPYAAALFEIGPWGWVMAVLYKAFLVGAITFISVYERKDPNGTVFYHYKVLNLAGFAVLSGADGFYVAIVLMNNIPLLR